MSSALLHSTTRSLFASSDRKANQGAGGEMEQKFESLAHSPDHPLSDHLRAVAALAAEFSAPFGSNDWGHLAGLWHDLGKYRPAFQAKLAAVDGIDAHIEGFAQRVTHSHAGALHAIQSLGPLRGQILAFLIAGHHSGLPDLDEASPTSLKFRLSSEMAKREFVEAMAQTIPEDILTVEHPASMIAGGTQGFALWVRMLFSSLVDADFLDTEAYYDSNKASKRSRYPSLTATKLAFDDSMIALEGRVASGPDLPVNRIRAEVLEKCRSKGRDAGLAPGFFELTVPTGGGKTFASLAFALEHAIAHDKRRIVYAIPYTSIIEQTAKSFRNALSSLGVDAVLEHHSNLDVSERKEDHASRLAAENWDAPLIVTTNVQLFESLHATRTSRCRKLHNLANSVIVLDEAQQLPRDFLAPILRALKLLVAHYGVTVLFCTATQPALIPRREPISNRLLLDGVDAEAMRPIIDDPQPMFDALRRVDIDLPADFSARRHWPEIAAEIAAHDCVLSIVNVRQHARELFALLPEDGAIHLSALMCAEHRSAVIEQIKIRLRDKAEGKDQRPLRVVSTQLVEAGVDLDFPVVFRALAGLDSIAQAAGRCNREGRLEGRGKVRVFVPPQSAPPGILRQGEQAMTEMAKTGRLADPLSPAAFTEYFNQLYAKDDSGFDRGGVLELLKHDRAAFRTAAERFRLIDNDSESIIVAYRKDGASESPVGAWLGALEKDGRQTGLYRKLQRYTVSVPRRIFEQMLRRGELEERAGLWLALDLLYDQRLGLTVTSDTGNPADYIC
ncbi:MAG TPA: CRISPR-associated endonuclease Cas3'' [Dokdonella sp.]|uniref:CRISPR-associated endonuclease Cas3'' n=1 Tax=Dokdonella sp. TaxID=2291710 RepID=UPI002D80ABA8|nr:CRISPR-associated endonuclease Cas3'' [Dokdonella sp.]HET9033419.1 CRISPR-associated endonuclease Cas3'' [Dokdonella sp.]